MWSPDGWQRKRNAAQLSACRNCVYRLARQNETHATSYFSRRIKIGHLCCFPSSNTAFRRSLGDAVDNAGSIPAGVSGGYVIIKTKRSRTCTECHSTRGSRPAQWFCTPVRKSNLQLVTSVPPSAAATKQLRSLRKHHLNMPQSCDSERSAMKVAAHLLDSCQSLCRRINGDTGVAWSGLSHFAVNGKSVNSK